LRAQTSSELQVEASSEAKIESLLEENAYLKELVEAHSEIKIETKAKKLT